MDSPPIPEAAHPRDELAEARARIAALTAEVRALRAEGEREGTIRLRNTLAIIRSVFRRTADTADTLEDLSTHFTGRFDALVRFGLGTTGQREIELEDIVRDELLKVGESDGDRIAIAGPAVPLDFRQAPLVGLAIHELVTNAIKFGALTTDGASLAIRWTLDGDRVTLGWTEANVPVIAPAPVRHGFGREFIEQALPYQMRARTSFELLPGGVRCEISLPLSDDQAADAPGRQEQVR